MISRQLETKHGITYWNISSDEDDDILTGSQRSGAFYRDSISGGAGNDTLSGGSGAVRSTAATVTTGCSAAAAMM